MADNEFHITVQSRDRVGYATDLNHNRTARRRIDRPQSSYQSGQPLSNGLQFLPPNLEKINEEEERCRAEGLKFKKLGYDMVIGRLSSIAVVDAVNMGFIRPDNEEAQKIIALQKDAQPMMDIAGMMEDPLYVVDQSKIKTIRSEYEDTTKDHLMVEDIQDVIDKGTEDDYLMTAANYDPVTGEMTVPGSRNTEADPDFVDLSQEQGLSEAKDMMKTAFDASSQAPGLDPSLLAETESMARQIAQNGGVNVSYSYGE